MIGKRARYLDRDKDVGTSGYSYKEWKGSFYPEKIPAKEMLSYYAGRLEYGGNQRHVLPHAAEKHVGQLEGTGTTRVPFFTQSPTARHPLQAIERN